MDEIVTSYRTAYVASRARGTFHLVPGGAS